MLKTVSRDELVETLVEFALYGRGVMHPDKVRETITTIVNELESRVVLRAVDVTAKLLW